MLGLAVAASAQPKAVGIRFGYAGLGLGEISYEHYYSLFGNAEDFIEGELGLWGNSGFKVSGLYNWTLWHPDWTDQGTWGLYAGPGAALGYTTYHDDNDELKGSPFLGLVAQVGLEYNFWFPLQLSLDLRPTLGWAGRLDPNWFVMALSARYAF